MSSSIHSIRWPKFGREQLVGLIRAAAAGLEWHEDDSDREALLQEITDGIGPAIAAARRCDDDPLVEHAAAILKEAEWLLQQGLATIRTDGEFDPTQIPGVDADAIKRHQDAAPARRREIAAKSFRRAHEQCGQRLLTVAAQLDEAATLRNPISHAQAVAMLPDAIRRTPLGKTLTAREASKLMERLRAHAGQLLRCEKRGNEWWYERSDVERIAAGCTFDPTQPADKNPTKVEINQRSAQVRATWRRRRSSSDHSPEL